MKKAYVLSTAIILFLVSSCTKDSTEELINFGVSFSKNEISLSETDTTKEIVLSFSREASENGNIIVTINTNNAQYGVDFTTNPIAKNGKITIPVTKGNENTKITFNKLKDPVEGTTKSVNLSIDSFGNPSWIKGNTSSTAISFTPVASKGGVIDLKTGGSNQPNQVYIDLSTGTQKEVKRDTWELGFYNGNKNRIFLNSSLLVAAAELEFTDLKSVTSNTSFSKPIKLFSFGKEVTVKNIEELKKGLPVSYSQYSNQDEGHIFTDSKEGDLPGTAFAEVSSTGAENKVYIISLGNKIPTEPAEPGKIKTTGDHRGFMKVRVYMDGDNYKVQYAPIDETENIKEITVTKNSNKVLTALSLSEGKVADVEPNKNEWDINFSGVFSFSSRGYGVTYSDYGLHNTLGGVGMYQVTLYKIDRKTGARTDFNVPKYTEFKASNVDESKLVYDNRTVINSGWRSYTKGVAKDDRYYVLKDASGNLYKIKFTALLSDAGERGYSQFTYEKL